MDPRLRDVIKQRAYGMWERAGRPSGRDLEYWLQAEQEVMQGHGFANTEPTAPPLAGEHPGASARLGGTPGNLTMPSKGRQLD
ncbi:MAG: DUF2934 domain-containing protein [Pseudomonadota bacterium]